jgi:signal transduction histidine kinase
VTDPQGHLVATAGRAPESADGAARGWLASVQHGPWLGDEQAARGLKQAAARAGDAGAARVIDAAAPMLTADGARLGVVGAHLAWDWIERLQAQLAQSFTKHRPVELLLASRDGMVLSGPPAWRGRSLQAPGGAADPTEAGAYLVQRAALDDPPQAAALHWTVLVRQRTDIALAEARAVQHTVFGVVLLAGLLAAAAAIVVTRRVLARLVRLADDARAVQRGERAELARPPGRDEIAGIGAILADAVAQLQAEKQALQALNAELDARVAERTARIERLADEQKHAAVVRERLRLARELHDTLAHSLMALLTQIRLARKLRARLTEADLDAELARAEEVAATGLGEARAAIAQMRHNAVRDSGLGEALRELLERFSQRSGIEHELRVRGAAGALAGERAETAFRIVEQALNNTERHAQAQHVRVTLTGGDMTVSGAGPRVRLEVADDGIGFDPAQERPGHYGLRGMREQAALIEARLQIESAPGTGTRVTLEFED